MNNSEQLYKDIKGIEVYVILDANDDDTHVASIFIRRTLSRVYAYVQWRCAETTIAYAAGANYDRRTAAMMSAISRLKSPSAEQFKAAALPGEHSDLFTTLGAAGYRVISAVR